MPPQCEGYRRWPDASHQPGHFLRRDLGSRLRDREHCRQAGEKRERHLARSRLMPLSDLREDTASGRSRRRETLVPERTVADDSNVIFHAPGDDLMFYGPFLQVITSSRRPEIACPTISSAAPDPYISAVSMCVIPRSIPFRSAAITLVRLPPSISQVPCPMTATSRVM